MPIVAVTSTMSSAELAKVREVTASRTFIVENEHGDRAVVEFCVDRDSLYCHMHKTRDGCACTARVRLCGILTHKVTYNAKVIRFDRKEG